MGKRVGKDAKRKKLTYPGLRGLDQSAAHARQLVDSACQALEGFDSRELTAPGDAHRCVSRTLRASAGGLEALARYVLDRNC